MITLFFHTFDLVWDCSLDSYVIILSKSKLQEMIGHRVFMNILNQKDK